jgi:hypothetical protein
VLHPIHGPCRLVGPCQASKCGGLLPKPTRCNMQLLCLTISRAALAARTVTSWDDVEPWVGARLLRQFRARQISQAVDLPQHIELCSLQLKGGDAAARVILSVFRLVLVERLSLPKLRPFGSRSAANQNIIAAAIIMRCGPTSLGKDAPCRRPVERFGDIVSYPILGGLHHRYARI